MIIAISIVTGGLVALGTLADDHAASQPDGIAQADASKGGDFEEFSDYPTVLGIIGNTIKVTLLMGIPAMLTFRVRKGLKQKRTLQPSRNSLA